MDVVLGESLLLVDPWRQLKVSVVILDRHSELQQLCQHACSARVLLVPLGVNESQYPYSI